jgi:hypothetical protein
MNNKLFGFTNAILIIFISIIYLAASNKQVSAGNQQNIASTVSAESSAVSGGGCTLNLATVGGGYTQNDADNWGEIRIDDVNHTVELENERILVRYGNYVDENTTRFAILDFIIKTDEFGNVLNEDQINLYGDAVAERGDLTNAYISYNGADKKTVHLEWELFQGGTSPYITEVTIYPNSTFLQIDYISYGINVVEIGVPGGTSTGTYVAYGAAGWVRGYDLYPDYYYSRHFPSNGGTDPADGGSLNYNGSFIVGVYNSANDRGFGRTLPVARGNTLNLLFSRGLEFYTNLNEPHVPFTSYLYAVTGGESEILSLGQQLVDAPPVDPPYTCNDTIGFTANAYTGWHFEGWSGDATGTNITTTVVLTGTINVTATYAMDTDLDYADDFQSYPLNSDPADWFDTGSNNSLTFSDHFKVFNNDNNQVFGTTSTLSNIHSHYTNFDIAPTGGGYEFTGRMMMTAVDSGLGVTFFSDYADSDAYYRLRRYGTGGSLHLEPHSTIVTGTIDSGFVPVVNIWHRFRIEVYDTNSQTNIKAMIWRDGQPEPTDWQIDAYDDTPSRLTSGKIGVWSAFSGEKYWDELAVIGLTPLSISTVGTGEVFVTPNKGLFRSNEQATLMASPDSGARFTGWGGEVSGQTTPLILNVTSANNDIVANFSTDLQIQKDDFDSYAANDDPTDWFDTDENNSLLSADYFKTFDVNGAMAFGTQSTLTNIHSHYIGTGNTLLEGGAATFTNYEYSGRMFMTDANGGIGITFFSQYPAATSYYRLRRFSTNSFHLASSGTAITSGQTDSGVVPVVNTWYRFRIQVLSTGTQTEIKAKVWQDGLMEPFNWQIDAVDDSVTRLTTGTYGVWSFNTGSKFWDDLAIQALPSGPTAVSLQTIAAHTPQFALSLTIISLLLLFTMVYIRRSRRTR